MNSQNSRFSFNSLQSQLLVALLAVVLIAVGATLIATAVADEGTTSLLIGLAIAVGLLMVMAVGVAVYLARRVVEPIEQISVAANRIVNERNYDLRLENTGLPEFSPINATINALAEEVQGLNTQLEHRVQERLKDLEATVEVGRLATTAATDAATLMPRLVNTIAERFNLYYVQVYDIDEAERYANLRAATGRVGTQLLKQKHRLDLEEISIVGRAVQSRRSVLVENTETSTIFFPNALLADTRSELAVPLLSGDRLLGILDMQATVAETFNNENVFVFEAMATQIASVLRSNAAFEEARQAIARADELNQRLVRENWEGYLGRVSQGGRLGYQYDLEAPARLDNAAALDSGLPVDGSVSKQVVPIHLGAQQIGNILVGESGEKTWSDDELRLVQAVAARVAQSIEQLRAFDETETRARELAIVAEVSTRATSTLNIDELLQSVADLTKESFGLYHAHIYLVSDDANVLRLAAGAGTVGRRMAGGGHSISMSQEYSVVARAARARAGVIENDVTRSANYLPNPLLPETRSEMAIPMIARGELVGILDVQSEQVGRFTEEDVQIKSTLASQLAVSLSNAQLFAQSQRRLEETEASNQLGELLRTAQDETIAIREAMGVLQNLFGADDTGYLRLDREKQIWTDTVSLDPDNVNPGALVDYPAATFPHGIEALQNQTVVAVEDPARYPNFSLEFTQDEVYGLKSVMVLPIFREDQAYGAIFLSYMSGRREFEPAEISAAQSFALQVSAGLERLRATDEILSARQQAEKRATELQAVAEVSSVATTVLDPDILLKTVSDLTRDRFGLYHAHIYLFNEDQTLLELRAGAGAVGDTMVSQGYAISVGHAHSLVARAARTRQGVVANDVFREPDFLPNPLLSETRAEMAIPIVQGDEIFGVLDVQAREINRFTDEDVQIKSTLAGQVAVALRNAQLFAQSEQRAVELQVVAEVSAVASTVLDPDELLNTVANLTRDRFNLYHAHIYLLNEEGTSLDLRGGAGDVGKIMIAGKHAIVADHEHSLVARAARTREGVISNNVLDEPDFLPNPLLPETRAEMAIPIIQGDQLMGVLDVQSASVHRFTDEDVRIQTTLAGQVAVALQNAQLFAQSELRALEMQVVAEVSAIANTVLDPDEMLRTVSDLTSDRFNLYHAQIYLMDDQHKRLLLHAGAGDAGQAMVSQKHSILLKHEHSLVARAARTLEAVISNNVLADPDYLPNPLLPETRAEMAVPIIQGTEILGVLDVQSERINRFNETDKRVKSTLAGQVAVALQNAQLFAASQRRLEETEAANVIGELLRAAEDERTALTEAMMVLQTLFGADDTGYLRLDHEQQIWTDTVAVDPDNLNEAALLDYPAATFPHGMEALQKQVAVAVEDPRQYPNFPLEFTQDQVYGLKSVLVLPIFRENEAYGAIFLSYISSRRSFETAEIAAAQSLALQISAGLDRLRATEEILAARQQAERRASELQVVAEVSAAAATILDPNELLTNISNLTKESFDLYHTHIYLLNDEQQILVLRAGAGEPGRLMVSTGHRILVAQEHSLVARAARTRASVISNDITREPDFLPNPLLPETRSEMSVPIIVGDDLIGILDVQANIANRYSEDDVQIFETLSRQIGIALLNARLYQEQLETAEQLREVDKLKSEFLASMSHELRTPLNSIIGYAEVILDGLDGPLNEDLEEDVGAIHGSGKLLLNLINDILDLAKIEAGQMELEYSEVDVKDFMQRMIDGSRILVKDKPVDLILNVQDDVPEIIHVDPVRLQQIVNNLISNAAKFTEEGSITLNTMADNGNIVVEVVDTGIGISDDQLELIFERFRQADQSSTRRAGGTGLGLDITRSLVLMHGGDISVVSTLGEGSKFTFTLPVEPPENGDAL